MGFGRAVSSRARRMSYSSPPGWGSSTSLRKLLGPSRLQTAVTRNVSPDRDPPWICRRHGHGWPATSPRQGAAALEWPDLPRAVDSGCDLHRPLAATAIAGALP